MSRRSVLLLAMFVWLAGPSFTRASDAAPAGSHDAAAKSHDASAPSHSPAADVHAPMESGVSPDEAFKLLKEGNGRFAAGNVKHPNADEARRADTAKNGQKPFATVVACSDSRVPVEMLFDRGIGDVFVIRVAGNVCDEDELGSAEYGVDHLGTPVLVVLGHTHCGAVTAVCTNADVHGHIPGLVDNIKPAVAQAKEVHPDKSPDALVPFAVRANVWQGIEDVLRKSPAIRERAKSGKVRIEGAIYDIATGKVEWLGAHPEQRELFALAGGDEHAAPTMPMSQTHGVAAASGHATSRSASTAVREGEAPDIGEVLERRMGEGLYRQGTSALSRGRLDEAADLFHRAIQIDPTMIAAQIDLAGVLCLQKQYAQAVAAYQAVLKIDPAQPTALRGAALAYAAQREYDKSKAMLEKLVSLDRRDARTYLELGDVLYLSGQTEQARQSWTQATQIADAAKPIVEKARLRLKIYPASRNASDTTARAGT